MGPHGRAELENGKTCLQYGEVTANNVGTLWVEGVIRGTYVE